METLNSSQQQPKIPEEKFKILQYIFEAVKETNPQKLIEEIQALAKAEISHHLLKTNPVLPSNYTYSDFLDQILHCLCNLQFYQNSFAQKIKEICQRKKKFYHFSQDNFDSWMRSCFIEKDIKFLKIVELCGGLYIEGHQIPFAFISTQILRLFHFPTSHCFNFLKRNFSDSIKEILKIFQEAPKQEIRNHIIHLVLLIFSQQDQIDKEKGQENFQDILKNLSFHILPYGYFVDAHTDYQKNIYLSDNILPEKTNEFQRILISVISIIHEIGHIRLIESAQYCNALEFVPNEDEVSLAEEIFGVKTEIEYLKRIDGQKILQDPNIKLNFLENLKEEFKKLMARIASGEIHVTILSVPKD